MCLHTRIQRNKTPNEKEMIYYTDDKRSNKRKLQDLLVC